MSMELRALDLMYPPPWKKRMARTLRALLCRQTHAERVGMSDRSICLKLYAGELSIARVLKGDPAGFNYLIDGKQLYDLSLEYIADQNRRRQRGRA